MLSNAAETNPRLNAVGHEAAGSFSTGIIDAHVTSARRKMEPFAASGSASQSGRRSPTVDRIASQTATPMKGNVSAAAANRRFTTTLVEIAATRMSATIPTRIQSMCVCAWARFRIGEYRCCCSEAGMPQTSRATTDAAYAGNTSSRAHAVDPHHGGGGVAYDAARTPRVGRRHDRREIADVHPGPEELVRHRAANERGGDVVEEAGQNEHDDEHREGALPVVGQHVREHHRHPALLEVARQERKSHQQGEQVGENDPLVLHVHERDPDKPDASLNPVKASL